MKFADVPESERKQARHPHEYFLVNLITNHILVFVALLGMAKQEPWLLLIVPIFSVVVLTYLMWRAKLSRGRDPWFVFCHWQLCARRSRFFIGMILLMGLGIAAILPTLFTVLVLILMESDAVHKARVGEVPDGLVRRYPPPSEYRAIAQPEPVTVAE